MLHCWCNYFSKKWRESLNAPKFWILISAAFALRFPGRRHFEFLWRNMVAPLLYTKERWFLTKVATILRHENSRWQRAGNFNAKTADINIHNHIHIHIHIRIFGRFKAFFPLFRKLLLHYRLYFQRFNISFLQQWRFPLSCLSLVLG